MLRPYANPHERKVSPVLAALCVALIVYASLYPMKGWRLPPGADLVDLMRLPWQRWITGFDTTSNLLGYLPLGMLLTFASLRERDGASTAVLKVLVLGAALSYCMEVLQQFVPMRVPSLLDWVLNTAGTLLGAVLAVVLDRLGWAARWRWLHDRWLERGGRGALALLLLWPIALLFPSPLPFGLGQVGGQLRELSSAVVDSAPWLEPLMGWLDATEVFEPASSRLETMVTILGLLAPCLLAYAASVPSWRRIALGLGVLVAAAGTVTLSTALNFGPEHALAWRAASATTGLWVAAVVSLALCWTSPRSAAHLALVALTGLVILVHLAPADPYFAQSLQAWEQGRFIRFHGLAQWVGWLWPYVAIVWLLGRDNSRR